MKKEDLTVKDLELMILKYNKIKLSDQERLQQRITAELGGEPPQESEKDLAFKEMMLISLCGKAAQHLKINNHSTPLLSIDDFDDLIPELINCFNFKECDLTNNEERKIAERVVKSSLEVGLDIFNFSAWYTNAYEAHWHWIEAVLKLSEEVNISPLQFLDQKNAMDEIIKLMYSKKEFITFNMLALEKVISIDTLKKIILLPILASLIEEDETIKAEMEEEIKSELLPMIADTAKQGKKIVIDFINREAMRIYGE